VRPVVTCTLAEAVVAENLCRQLSRARDTAGTSASALRQRKGRAVRPGFHESTFEPLAYGCPVSVQQVSSKVSSKCPASVRTVSGMCPICVLVSVRV